MSVATTGYLSCLYRSDPVRAAFCRWHRNTRFCAHRAQENKCHWHATDSARNVAIPVTRDFAKPLLESDTSNPHSAAAYLDPVASTRGFLPRGL